jgi:pimeloyl-ACP methyl ester carboxylesterase
MRLRAHSLPGLLLTDHVFTVPLDHGAPDGEQIDVFAREAVAPKRQDDSLPWLVFFQGGPGSGALRPTGRTGWLKRALQEYRVLLLDQRGTGLSTPATHQTLARLGSAQAQADYLKHFRADAIVRDAELIRRDLLGRDSRWSVLGQSYGGFCVTRYLSSAPEGLREAIITGGLPPLERPADDVYRATFERTGEKNRLYYDRYPEDVQQVQEIVEHISTHEVHLANGDRLTPRRLQQLGLYFGADDGFEQTHYLLEEAFVDGAAGREISYRFLRGFENAFHFQTNPIFAILHESIYCQETASEWAAARIRSEYPEFAIETGRPVFFTGEMIFPWMFDDYKYLRPLKEAARILAAFEEWPRLYDLDVLRGNSVPSAAAVYYHDMYVDRVLSEETARNIRGMKVWVTNEYEHNGLRSDGEVVLGRLLDMLHGEC